MATTQPIVRIESLQRAEQEPILDLQQAYKKTRLRIYPENKTQFVSSDRIYFDINIGSAYDYVNFNSAILKAKITTSPGTWINGDINCVHFTPTLFRRVKIVSNGVELSNIDNYNVLMTILLLSNIRKGYTNLANAFTSDLTTLTTLQTAGFDFMIPLHTILSYAGNIPIRDLKGDLRIEITLEDDARVIYSNYTEDGTTAPSYTLTDVRMEVDGLRVGMNVTEGIQPMPYFWSAIDILGTNDNLPATGTNFQYTIPAKYQSLRSAAFVLRHTADTNDYTKNKFLKLRGMGLSNFQYLLAGELFPAQRNDTIIDKYEQYLQWINLQDIDGLSENLWVDMSFYGFQTGQLDTEMETSIYAQEFKSLYSHEKILSGKDTRAVPTTLQMEFDANLDTNSTMTQFFFFDRVYMLKDGLIRIVNA